MTSIVKQIKAPVKIVAGISTVGFLASMLMTHQVKGWSLASAIGIIAGGVELMLWGLEQTQYGPEGRP